MLLTVCALATPTAWGQEPPAPTPAVDPGAPESAADAAAAAEAAAEAEAAAAAILAAERGRVSRFAAGELARARTSLGEAAVRRDAAEQEVATARTAQRVMIRAHESAIAQEGDARRDLGNLARLAYTSGPTEWTLIETFLDADGPQDALRRASVSQLVAERQDDQWDEAVAGVAALGAELAAAAGRVAVAEAELGVAQGAYAAVAEQVASIAGAIASGGMAGTDGAAAVAEICGPVEIPQCERSGWGEGQLTRDAVWLMRVVRAQWPQIETVGGYRPVDTYPDHPTGRAVDVMVPDAGRSAEGVEAGDEIAQYFMEHADEYGVMYLLWNQRVWRSGHDPIAPPQEWRPMEDRGDWTSNHKDHVHICVSTGVSGSDIYSVVGAAR